MLFANAFDHFFGILFVVSMLFVGAITLMFRLAGKAAVKHPEKASMAKEFGKKVAVKGLEVALKRLLRKYGYPPDLQDEAVQNVLQQAEALAAEWA